MSEHRAGNALLAQRPRTPGLPSSWEHPARSGQNAAPTKTWLLLTIARGVHRNMFKNRPHLLNVTPSNPVTFPMRYDYSLGSTTDHKTPHDCLWLFIANKYARLQVFGAIVLLAVAHLVVVPCTHTLFCKLVCLCLVLPPNQRHGSVGGVTAKISVNLII